VSVGTGSVGTGKNTRTSIFDKLNDENNNMTPGRTNNTNDKLNNSQINNTNDKLNNSQINNTNDKLNNSQIDTECKDRKESKSLFKRDLTIEVEDPNDTSLRESRSDYSSHNLNVSKQK